MALFAGPVKADPFKPGFKQQVELGQKAAAQIRNEEKIVKESDPRVQLMRKVAQKLTAHIPENEIKKHPYKWSFDLVDSKEVNAFALPGGPIFFYTGLFEKFSTVDELAAVLGHEMTHIREEHWANAYADQQKRNLGITAVLMIIRANQDMVNIASISNEVLLSLPYSRGQESKADRSGFRLMVDAGYNPKGMLDLFDTLAKAGGGGGTPEFLRTHPADKSRKNEAQKLIDAESKKGTKFPATTPMPKF
ncbi:MAG: M48 family metalloprotease [Armatimonadetes bacterium]|nr:M48 family metalloprotease [Armatimonadota bacterium]